MRADSFMDSVSLQKVRQASRWACRNFWLYILLVCLRACQCFFDLVFRASLSLCRIPLCASSICGVSQGGLRMALDM